MGDKSWAASKRLLPSDSRIESPAHAGSDLGSGPALANQGQVIESGTIGEVLNKRPPRLSDWAAAYRTVVAARRDRPGSPAGRRTRRTDRLKTRGPVSDILLQSRYYYTPYPGPAS
eukprot:639985-Hanusia_phi.AAC.1